VTGVQKKRGGKIRDREKREAYSESAFRRKGGREGKAYLLAKGGEALYKRSVATRGGRVTEGALGEGRSRP